MMEKSLSSHPNIRNMRLGHVVIIGEHEMILFGANFGDAVGLIFVDGRRC
jgi:hypothetical protein